MIDSVSSAWTGDGITIVVDEGPFAADLTRHEGAQDYRLGPDTIAGLPSHTVSFTDRDGSSVAGARIQLPRTQERAPTMLTITVRTDPGLGREAAIRIIESMTRD